MNCLVRPLALAAALSLAATAARADEPCPGNPKAIGTSRTLTVSPREFPRLGLMQYRQSLPLEDHEVVLTFDDGPILPYTDRALEILAHNCVKATFFLVGQHALVHPDAARRVYEAGHTIGNHSQHHVLRFDHLSEPRAENEVESGARTFAAIFGTDKALAPFFRIPGLGRTPAVERYLQAQSLIVWSTDTLADDWTRISSAQVLARALRRLEEKKKGILLLHDIHARTVNMLPALLAELKKRNFRIVHVVPEGAPETPPPLPPSTLVAAGKNAADVASADASAIPAGAASASAAAGIHASDRAHPRRKFARLQRRSGKAKKPQDLRQFGRYPAISIQ